MRRRERDKLALMSVPLVCISGRDLWCLEWDVGMLWLSVYVSDSRCCVLPWLFMVISTIQIKCIEFFNISSQNKDFIQLKRQIFIKSCLKEVYVYVLRKGKNICSITEIVWTHSRLSVFMWVACTVADDAEISLLQMHQTDTQKR